MSSDSGRARARVGSVVAGKYRLVERLGGGGMGEVFRAENQYAGRVVALKLLRRDFAEDPDLTRRFFQEAQAVNKIRHPNIVDVLDAGFCEEGPYVAMEILEGASLSTALARVGRLDVPTALAIVLPMLDALDSVHRHGIVHRDLKPENVYLARYPAGVAVKLVDFGIAKVLDGGRNTNTGVVFGTPDYLSPEQASGEGVIDGRSDVFAVGIVLFELLTGKRPFEASTAVATAYKIVHSPAPRLDSLGVKVDERLQEALDFALAKGLDDRFMNAAAFADMLAPHAPDGASRRAALLALVDAVVGMQPTQAAPAVGLDATVSPSAAPPAALSPVAPRAPSPPPPPPFAPRRVDPAPTPVTRPLPPPVTSTPVVREPPALTPTLASSVYVTPRERLSSLREPTSLRDPTPPREPTPLPDAPGRPTPPRTAPLPRLAPPPRSAPTPTPGPGSGGTGAATGSGRLSPSGGRAAGSGPRGVTWSPRLLPAHVRGRCHVRGSLPRAVRRWVVRTFGGDACDRALEALPPMLADSYRADEFNALVWYDIEALDTFLEAATALVLGGDPAAWRGLAREHFEADLGTIFRTAARTGDPAGLLKRSAPTWGRLFDFAGVRIGEPSRQTGPQGVRVTVRFDGFDAASLAMRNMTLGIAEGLLRSTGTRDVTARVLSGEVSFLRDFEFELAWVAPG